MGQKIHPTGFRLAVSRNWGSRWFANPRDFGRMLNEDIKVREYLRGRLKSAAVGRVLLSVLQKMRGSRYTVPVPAL